MLEPLRRQLLRGRLEQVAFCTNNIVPGVDFSNDPLLQGRNFSYLDTQLKRLGGPNFTHIPVNAPKCPFHNPAVDGHMAMVNPKGRVNYEPNSRGGAEGGPRESPELGFKSFPAEEGGRKVRERSESFADHFSQARQFYISQTPVEQGHIADALVFELSKVEEEAIRERVVSHLPHIDSETGRPCREGFGNEGKDLTPPRPPWNHRSDLKKSKKALSIILNPPELCGSQGWGSGNCTVWMPAWSKSLKSTPRSYHGAAMLPMIVAPYHRPGGNRAPGRNTCASTGRPQNRRSDSIRCYSMR